MIFAMGYTPYSQVFSIVGRMRALDGINHNHETNGAMMKPIEPNPLAIAKTELPLDYQNRRKDFVEAYLNHLVNWEFAASALK